MEEILIKEDVPQATSKSNTTNGDKNEKGNKPESSIGRDTKGVDTENLSDDCVIVENNFQEPGNKRVAKNDNEMEGYPAKKKIKIQSEDTSAESFTTTVKTSYGLSDPEKLCDVCFTPEAELEKDGKLPEGQYPFIKCRSCQLLVHSICFAPFAPEGAIDQNGYFTCDACTALRIDEALQSFPHKSSSRDSKSKKIKKDLLAPLPLPSDIEAKDDGRLYPIPKHPGGLDIYCILCLRRDVMGGMKPPTYGASWCHLACSMSSPAMYVKGNRITGIKNALIASRKVIRNAGIKKAECECCQRPGGMLSHCAHNYELGNKKLCNVFQHPLCAELGDRNRVIVSSKSGDIILYKCALHSFGDDALCAICGFGSRQNEMLECEGCSGGFHMSCLPTPLKDVPENEWFCTKCRPEDHVSPEKLKDSLPLLINSEFPTSTEKTASDVPPTIERNNIPTSTGKFGGTPATEKKDTSVPTEQVIDAAVTEKTNTSVPTRRAGGDTPVTIKAGAQTKQSKITIFTEKSNVPAFTQNVSNSAVTEKMSAPDSIITVIGPAIKETGITDSIEQAQDFPGADEVDNSVGTVKIKRHRTADSFPIGVPPIDFSFARNSEPTKS
eukprot:CAMPEP_0197823992 /NCGR_PEP_ID=MMETSP1437-20131217/1303_1 /TAXON_ID=49252 ORGANISM="Eucampia antarctica, Strain CCMP1452" /NCGR_SAMPLE_ID=MMETSP1437 /ASSEMBLY_ACC=CAM_ASM_001096 /LENGTH=609 /DNA_ID=CAMNT_0043423439 /DNA_START=51 /DNA_END=1880 /DNA_ORIENTATION=+